MEMTKRKHWVKKILTAVIVFAVLLQVLPFSNEMINVNAASPGFHIKEGKLYDANENVFIMKGINHAHSWYKSSDETALKAIKATGANTVRIVLSNGKKWTYDDAATVKNIINLCKQNQLICILEVHDATGSDNVSDLENAASYFIEIKSALIGNEDTVIVNIANEWYGSWGSDTWAKGYTSVIPKLRNAGIKNTIMVDCAGYGQYPKSVKEKGKEVFKSDPQSNVIFSVHMYEYAGGKAATIKENIDGVVNSGLPLCIGEFGYKHTDGDVDEDYLINYCEKLGLGWLAWSWNGNSDNVKYLDIAKDMAGTGFTEWGDILLNHKYGLKTGKVCSVFSGTPSATESPVTTTTEPPVITTTTPPESTPTQPASSELQLKTSTSTWQGGYQMNFTITNNTGKNVNGWKLLVNKNDFNIANIWGAETSESGKSVTITPLDWNKNIKAGSSVSFGLTGNGSPVTNFTYKIN